MNTGWGKKNKFLIGSNQDSTLGHDAGPLCRRRPGRRVQMTITAASAAFLSLFFPRFLTRYTFFPVRIRCLSTIFICIHPAFLCVCVRTSLFGHQQSLSHGLFKPICLTPSIIRVFVCCVIISVLDFVLDYISSIELEIIASTDPMSSFFLFLD